MSRNQLDRADGESPTERGTDGDDRFGETRRCFLQSTATAGALATGLSIGSTDVAALQSSSATSGIPTPRLHVDGNLIKDPGGNTVTLRGLNVADPKRLNVTAPARGKTAEHVVDLLTDESRDESQPHRDRHPQ